jgi:hypothetical protein
MKKVEILAVCSHPEILQTILRLINNNPDWNATGAEMEEQALDLLDKQHFNLVLLGSGMDETSAGRLKAVAPAVKCIQHYGGGSGLLSAEIYGALNSAGI